MEKVTLFENLLNATDRDGNKARHATVTNFAALMGVDDQTVFDLLTLYRTAIRNEASEMILGVGFGMSGQSWWTATAPPRLSPSMPFCPPGGRLPPP